MWVIASLLWQRILAGITASAVAGPYNGPLTGTYLGCYIGPTPVLSPASLIGSITEAGWTGYARQALTWWPPYTDVTGAYALEAHALHYAPTDAVAPQIATGIFVADALVAGNLLASFQLTPPGVPMQNALDAFTAVVQFLFPASMALGAPTIVD
jgi:hypothetical protein